MTEQASPGAAAARLLDPIAHTNAHGRFWAKVAGSIVGGLVVGALAVGAAALVVGTGGLATPLVVAGGMTLLSAGGLVGAVGGFFGGMAGEAIVDKILPETFTVTGQITSASTNVFVNSPATGAARASPDNPLDTVECKRDSGPIFIAEGAETVFVNQAVFSRKGDAVECGAVIQDGSPDVFVGDPKARVREVADEVPLISRILGGVIGLVGGVRGLIKCVRGVPGLLRSKLPCLAKFGIEQGIDMTLGAIFNPVHIATGAKILTGEVDTDFVLPGPLPLRWSRAYNSLDTRSATPHGQGWGGEWTVRLQIAGSGAHTYIDDQGREVLWDAVAPGHSQENVSEGYVLYHTEDGQYAIESPDGLYRFFEPLESDSANPILQEADAGQQRLLRLMRVEDDHGNFIALRYHSGFEIKNITDSTGRLLEFAYTQPGQAASRRLASIRLATAAEGEGIGQLVRYDYHASGQLARVVNREGITTREFDYNAAQLMTMHRNADGFTCHYEWGLFADHPRVIRHWTNQGDDYQLEHVLSQRPAAQQPGQESQERQLTGGHTRVRDQLGRDYLFEWDADYNLVQSTDALGHVITQHWNALRQRTALIDPQGHTTRYTYDPHGNESTVTDALERTTRTTWLGFRALPLAIKYADGRSEHFAYDRYYNLIAHTDALGQRTEFGYDQRGLPIISTDAKGGVQRYAWTARAQLAQFTDCSDRTSTYQYDTSGHLRSSTDAAGHVHRYVHSLTGLLQALELPDGAHYHFSYSKAGALLGRSDPYARQTQFRRNLRGQLLQRTDAEGRQIHLDYDQAHRLQTLANENGETYAFGYDASDRLVHEQRIGGTSVEVAYDASGWPIAVTYHPRAGTDAADTNTADPGIIAVQTGSASTAAPGAEAAQPRHLELIRDAAGRLIEKRSRHLHYHYRYDAADQLLEASVHSVHYLDAQDLQELAEQARLGLQPEQAIKPWRLKLLHSNQFVYDALGQLVEETAHDHLTGQTHTLTHQHDPLGNRTQTTLPALPQGHRQAAQQRALNYLYYGSGHLHQINFSLQAAAGPAQGQPELDASAQQSLAVHQLICDLERDELHQEVWRSQGTLSTRLQRDALGRRTGAWSRSRSLDDGVLAQDDNWPDAIQGLQTAQPIERKELTGLLKTWQYDKTGELRLAQHSLQGARGHQYDATGRIEHSQRVRTAGSTGSLPQAANERFQYDPAGNLQDASLVQASQGPHPQVQRGYVQDNLVRVFEDKRFYYDGHDRLVEKRSGKHSIQRFVWDEENRLKAVYTTRRPGTEHENTQSTHFRYDALGRRIVKQDAFGTTVFIWEGMRLIEERRGSQITSYVYELGSYVPLARLDASGDATEQGGLGTQADPATDAPSVQQLENEARIAEALKGFEPTPHSGTGIAANDAEAQYWASLDQPDPRYLEGAQEASQGNGTTGLGALNASSNPELCKVYYFHTDQVGMPEELTNADGQLVWQASYTTWGATVAEEWQVKTLANQEPIEQGDKPESEQNLRFQGQYLDRSTGLHYNTFRYYDADMGRFICPDPIGLQGGINLASYAPNPLSWIDPWGWSCGVHGNSNASTKPNHVYVIVDTRTGNLMKPGISGQKMNVNGTSPRANRQLAALNANSPGRYKAVIVENNVTRVDAKIVEQRITDTHAARNDGAMPSVIHQRPKPSVQSREEYIDVYGIPDNR
ncbi:sugar-binding protein [Lampropedia aestuarii]|uniref:Sugar-binding protein n=1 Tax=Lampropedia aestuarii TaxID=2562762 RepID=A0A4S5BGV5_9BURK|nr:RHS repeat-associated core domain-containing protein [Lampropedia aestuarii]THJ31584.1 sugar-binding protein [Lampropedia aestuarii]